MHKPNWEIFQGYFETVELPITLTEELSHTFDQYSRPLPAQLVEEYLKVIDHGAIDEFTEYIPCFSIPVKDDYVALVYWKAGLLLHEYHLTTYRKDGKLIDHAILCGIKSFDDKIKRSVATIEEDMIIRIVEGISDQQEEKFDPGSSRVFHLEVLPNGQIIISE
jgi:hypothetical protein